MGQGWDWLGTGLGQCWENITLFDSFWLYSDARFISIALFLLCVSASAAGFCGVSRCFVSICAAFSGPGLPGCVSQILLQLFCVPKPVIVMLRLGQSWCWAWGRHDQKSKTLKGMRPIQQQMQKPHMWTQRCPKAVPSLSQACPNAVL